MTNEIVSKNVQNGKVEKWLRLKGINNNNEIQKFKSNVLAISNNYGLDKADLNTLISACYQSVLLNLPLEKNFGYCWVVPFKGKAQFQMGYKGYIQLALRTNQYKNISVSEVRENEIKNNDPLKGITFQWIQNPIERLKAKIIGYVAYFELTNGFEKYLYWSNEQVEIHFNKYSETYKKNKKFTLATVEEMALKTVLTQILRKWGIMSTEMKIAYESDQAVITENEKIYVDNPKNDNQKVKLKPIDEKINDYDHLINDDDYINKHIIEKLELIEEPLNEYQEMKNIIDELEI